MLIMTKNRQALVCLDNIIKIEQEYLSQPEGYKVRYSAVDIVGGRVWLGTYDDTPEHQNLIEKIAQNCGAINVFYMPKE